MSLILMVLSAAVVVLLAARWIKNRKPAGVRSDRQQPSVAQKGATRSSRSSRFDLDPLSSDELNFNGDQQPDALTSSASLSKPTAPAEKPPALIVIHAIAGVDKPYQGYDLLQALLANNLRFGDRKIFHRYDALTSSANPLYSVTSMNKPGTFDLPKMNGFSCDGLIFFAQLDLVEDPAAVCQMMLDGAEKLIGTLGGYLADESRAMLSTEAVSAMREQAEYCAGLKPASAVNQ